MKTLDSASFFADLPKHLSTVQVFAFVGTSAGLVSYMERFGVSTSPFNFTGWARPDFDRALAKAASFDRAERERRLFVLQKRLWEEGGDLVWGYAQVLNAASPRVSGVKAAGFAQYPLFKDAFLA